VSYVEGKISEICPHEPRLAQVRYCFAARTRKRTQVAETALDSQVAFVSAFRLFDALPPNQQAIRIRPFMSSKKFIRNSAMMLKRIAVTADELSAGQV
jgi:hypothetical protein